jgi:hypothetical protein
MFPFSLWSSHGHFDKLNDRYDFLHLRSLSLPK